MTTLPASNTPETDAWLATQPEYTKKWEVTHLLRQLERDRHELIEALRELSEADLALYPAFETGKDAQASWATRKSVAHMKARCLLKRVMDESVKVGCTDHLDCWDDCPWYDAQDKTSALLERMKP